MSVALYCRSVHCTAGVSVPQEHTRLSTVMKMMMGSQVLDGLLMFEVLQVLDGLLMFEVLQVLDGLLMFEVLQVLDHT